MSVSQAALEFPRLRGRRIRTRIGWVLSVAAFILVAAPPTRRHPHSRHRAREFRRFPRSFSSPQRTASAAACSTRSSSAFVLSGGALIIGVPIGVGAGMSLSEFGDGFSGNVVRFLSDVLTGIPSIVLGYFAYITMIIGLGCAMLRARRVDHRWR